MKISYWACRRLWGYPKDNIRARTKKEAITLRYQEGVGNFGPPTKITVEAKTVFDLLKYLLGEGCIELERDLPCPPLSDDSLPDWELLGNGTLTPFLQGPLPATEVTLPTGGYNMISVQRY